MIGNRTISVDQVASEQKRITQKIAALEEEVAGLKIELQDLDAVMRVAERIGDAPTSEERPPPKRPPRPGATRKNAMLDALTQLSGSKVGVIADEAERASGLDINKKTAGNILWALKKEGIAYRAGQNWYLANKVPENETPSEDESEGVSSSTGEDNASPIESGEVFLR